LFSLQRYRFVGLVSGHRFDVMLVSLVLRSEGTNGISSSEPTVCVFSNMTPIEIESGSYVVVAE